MSTTPSNVQEFSVREFFARFPNDDACLEHVMEQRHGLKGHCKFCGVETTFHRMTDRKAFAGAECGHHVYPCADTIFKDSRTPLQSWYYAIYLFVATRHGVSAKELQRQLGVTYKTAHRMGKQIRDLMAKADGHRMLSGHVELDEAYMGGHRPRAERNSNKTIVMGLKERGGRMMTQILPDIKTHALWKVTTENVERGSIVSTDELRSYNLLTPNGYVHGRVQHGTKEYARFDAEQGVLHHTNSVENFWRLFKDSIRSTHIHVSSKYIDKYLREFTFRANHRERGNLMFDLLIHAL